MNFLYLFVGSRFSIFLLNYIVRKAIFEKCSPTVCEKPLKCKDYAFILTNMVLETIFMLKIYEIMEEISFVTPYFPLLTVVLILADDAIYTPFHFLMHQKTVYKYVHAHHHANSTPTRGYIDAINETPIEMGIALAMTYILIYYFAPILCWSSILLFVFVKAIVSIVNHTSSSNPLYYGHVQHHIQRRVNYGQIEFYE